MLKAREEAQKEGLDITPRDGAEAARRNYEDSYELWNSRFHPGARLLVIAGTTNRGAGGALEESCRCTQQMAEVLELEKQRHLFQQGSFQVDSLLDRRARHFATHRDAGV